MSNKIRGMISLWSYDGDDLEFSGLEYKECEGRPGWFVIRCPDNSDVELTVSEGVLEHLI